MNSMRHDERFVVYNYVESPTEPLGDIVNQTSDFVGGRTRVFGIPKVLLPSEANLAELVLGPINRFIPYK
jgi:hypothetical protein